MEIKTVKRNRLLTVFLTLLCSAVIFCCALWANFGFSATAEESDAAPATYKYTLTDVSVSLRDGWIFTDNTPDSSLYRMLNVSVTYSDTAEVEEPFTRALEVSVGGTAATGESVAFSIDKNTTTVTVTVTPAGDDYEPTPNNGTYTYTKASTEQAVISGITAEYKEPATEVTTATQVGTTTFRSNITVYNTYNDGSRNDSSILGFSASGDLFPSVLTEDIIKGDPYSKAITVTYGGESTSVLITNIKFVAPYQIYYIAGNLQTQVARSTRLNLDDLTVSIGYNSVPISVPASAFPANYFRATYTDKDNNPVDTLTTSVKNITVYFEYPEKTAVSQEYFDIEVSRISIHTPVFPGERLATESELSWDNGASVDITSWDFDSLHTDTGDAPDTTIAVYRTVDEKLVSATIDNGDEKKTVHFPAAGYRYRIVITLSAAGDFMWGTPYNGSTSNENMTVSFEVQVDKGKPTVTLSAIDDTTYGTPNGNGAPLTATVNDVDMGKTWNYTTQSDHNAYKNTDEAWYYRLEYYTDEAAVNLVPTAELRSYDGKPKNAGTYYAVAVTYENSGYQSVKSAPVSFEVKKYEIKTNVADKTFARTEWTINDFFSSVNSFPYSDNALTVMDITQSGTALTTDDKFYHADDYTVSVSVKSTQKSNYKLPSDATSATVSFAIKTSESAFTFSVNNWTYSDAAADPNISVTVTSSPYYPKNTGSLTDKYTVTYYEYDESNTADNYKGAQLSPQPSASDFSKLEVGKYVVELIAKKDDDPKYTNDTTDENAGTKVDYTLPRVCKTFEVMAFSIVAPTLDETAGWSLTDTDGVVYTYNDNNPDGKDFGLINWIGDENNTAADGSSKIITVEISYTTFVSGTVTDITTGFSGGGFAVNYAGDYTVTVTLNSNYSWGDKDADGNDVWKPDDNEYTYYGKVARQQLTVLTDGDITSTKDVYDGTAQTKTIDKWNANALNIKSVTVSGLDDDHTPVSGGWTTTAGSADFDVTNAGKYTVEVEIADKDNYEWDDDEGSVGELSLEYKLYRAPLNVKWETTYVGTFDKENGSYPRFEYNGTLDGQNTPAATLDVFTADNDKIQIDAYTLYPNTGDYDSVLEKVTAVGFYRIVVSAISGDAEPNYYLPATDDADINNIATVFEIYAKTLARPELIAGEGVDGENKAITVVYRGEGYKLSEFIKDFADKYKLNNALLLDIKCGDGANDPTLISVKWNDDGSAIVAYTVTVKPADNYAWDSGVTDEELEYTITITQKEVVIAWGATEFETTYGNVEQPKPTVSNPEGDDTVNITLGYTYNKDSSEVANISSAGAGEYTVYAASLSDNNYKIGSGESRPFTIKKKVIDIPTLPTGSVDYVGDGASDFVALNAPTGTTWSTYDGVVSISASGVVPSGWFKPSGASDLAISDGGTFTVNNGTFTYTRAGVYTFTVTLTEYENYCFEVANEKDFTRASAYAHTASDKLTVNRHKLTAPAINEKRAQQWEVAEAIDFGTAVDGVAYTVAFCKVGSDSTSSTWLGGAHNDGERGTYYAELTLTVADALNYVWVENTADTDGRDYVTTYANYYYSESKVAIRLYYAITSSQINISVSVNGYTFGDNGVLGLASFNNTTLGSDSAATVYIVGDSEDLAKVDNAATLTDFSIVDEDEVQVTELVNGLPWNVGEYTLKGSLVFGDGKTYQPRTVSVKFTVAAREISVDWDDLSAEYDGGSHMATATVNTVVKKTDSDDGSDYTKDITLVVKSVDDSGNVLSDPINADSYTVKVTGITAESGAINNFKLPDNAITETLVITPKAVTVTANAVTNHVYRDIITAAEKTADASAFLADGAADHIQVKILDGEGENAKEIDQTAPVGEYYVVVSWADDGVHKTNYSVSFVSATFNVVARELTVALNAANANGEYGDEVDLYSDSKPIYNVTSHTGSGDPLGGLSASDVFVFTCDANATAAVGDHDISTGINDTNFDITFDTTTAWKYHIGNATITVSGDIEGIDGTAYQAADIAALKAGYAVTTKNSTAAVWQYAFVGSASDPASAVTVWNDFSGGAPTVRNAGDYYLYVRVTADNHNDYTTDIIHVKVEKAELTVSASFAIMYGEADPTGVNYKKTIDDLRDVNGIYTVTGFAGSDEDLFTNDGGFYNIGGSVGYSVADFAAAVQSFVLTVDTSALTCDNYTFKAAAGTLTVNRIKLTVTIDDKTVVYHTAEQDHPALTYSVTLPKSTYDPSADITLPDGDTYATIFTLSSDATTSKFDLGNGSTANTAKVGEYDIIGTNNKTAHYDITFVDGTYTVTAADLAMSDIAGYTVDYDESDHKLLVKDGDGNVTETIAATVDGSDVTVTYYTSSSDVTDFGDDSLAALGAGSSDSPKFIDVGTYYVVYKVTATNHTTVAACKAITITAVDNEFTTEFAFANGKQFGSDVESIADTDAAWVYGLYSSKYTDGYNKNGDQKTTEPVAKFTRLVAGGENALTFTLEYSAEIDGSYTHIRTASSAADMFEGGFAAKVFYAGYYKLTASMSAGDSNYGALSKTWMFRVAKRDLTVTANPISLMFGDDVTSDMYVGVYSGLAINSTVGTADTIVAALGNAPTFSTDYTTGSEVDTYTITVSGATDVTNYNVTYNTAVLTVTQREVTITIHDQENTYNLQNGEQPKTLTFGIAGGNFYNIAEPDGGKYDNDNQSIVALYTDALTNAGSVATNDVIYNDGVIGGYTIYAKYVDDFAKKNYIIKFVDCTMTETRDGAIVEDGVFNAGKYTIKQATFNVSGLGVFHMVGETEVKSEYYSGAKNYYKAQFDGNSDIAISFEYSLASNPEIKYGTGGVENVGTYRAEAFITNHNYTAGGFSTEFTIRQTTLTLTAVATTIEYGTPLPTTATADRFGGFTYTSHSEREEYGAFLETLTPETKAAYINAHPVTFRSTNYSTSTAAGTSGITIVPVCSGSSNVLINPVAAVLKIIKRNVTVTVVGYDDKNEYASCYYQGVQSLTQAQLDSQLSLHTEDFISVDAAATFGSSGDSIADLGVKLSLPSNAIDVTQYGYGMTVYSDATDYNINFVTSKTAADREAKNRIESGDADAPMFLVKKAQLTLYANYKSGNNAAPYSFVYGSSIPLEYAVGGTLFYAVDGMKNDEEFSNLLISKNGKLTYTIMCGAKAYAAWVSTTQETYTVGIAVSPTSGSDAVVFDNYEITTCKTAQLTITKLTIEASTANQVFEKAADGYHGGEYGKSHEAVIKFTGGITATEQNINVTYRPAGFTLKYDTTTQGSYQTAGKAPTVVGDYNVTVTLAQNGNYMFAGGAMSVKLPFSVTQRVISDADLVWARTQIGLDGESEFSNIINNYVDDIMTISSFMFSAQFGDSGRPISNGTSGSEYYTFDENGRLVVHFGNENGTYTVNFALRDSATHNYVFESKNGTVVISSFAVSSDKVLMTVKVADFTYRDTPSAPVVTINGSSVTTGLVITYGKVTDTSNIGDYVGKGDDFGGFDLADLAALKYDTLKASSTFDAGYYVVYVQHSESSQSKYYVFRVNERAIAAPHVVGDVPNVYNGQRRQLAFEYDLSTVLASYSGTSVQSATGTTFYATNAYKYEIQFRLVDSANYKWADSVIGVEDGVWTYTWTIAKDSAAQDTANPYISMPAVNTLVFGQTFSRSTASVRAGYEGNIVYYYMSKSVSSSPAVDSANWVRGIPSDADEYWIKAVVSDGNVNFSDKATIASLAINAKQITATAYGSLIYGEAFDENNFRYTVDGLLYGDKVTESAGFKAQLAADYGTLRAGGEYYIILDHDGDGVVTGLSAGKNYVITAVQGALTVDKRDVTVTIGSLSGYYTVKPDVSDVSYIVTNLAPGDDASALGILFTTDATSNSSANGQYWITAASYDNSDYNVTAFNRGVYTVMRLTISVELTEQTGIVYGDSGIVGATMGAITSDVEDADIDKVRSDLMLSFTYAGTTFGGVEYADTTAPTAAGNYTVSLVGVNDNYTLVGSAYVEFTIAKKVVDVAELSIANQAYSGKPLTPVVNGGTIGSGIYTVADTTFTNAGSHDVALTLVDAHNYVWSTTDSADIALTFVIDKIADSLVGTLDISGWQYGCYDEKTNSPSATVSSGERIAYQYSADGQNYTNVVPENGNAGTYYVRVYVAESDNYFEYTSEPVRFEIARFVVASPSLTIITDGEGKNDVFTGDDLMSDIVGYNPRLMQIAYDGRINIAGDSVKVFGHDAEVYTVYISLFNVRNYCFGTGDDDNDGTIELKWTVARKKISKPTHDDSTKIVNGGTIVYVPIGFDPSIMEIDNNAYSYGGTFSAEIKLKDTKNYEWQTDGSAESDDKPFVIEWHIVGADSVFTAVISVLAVLAAAGCVGLLVQFLLYKRRKRVTAETMRDIETGETAANQNEGGDK